MKQQLKIIKIIKSFFYRGDDFQPIYFWVTIIMGLIIGMIIQRMSGDRIISDALIISSIGAVVTLLGIYNWNNIKNPQVMVDKARQAISELKGKIEP